MQIINLNPSTCPFDYLGTIFEDGCDCLIFLLFCISLLLSG